VRDSDRKEVWLRLRGLADEDRDLLTRKDRSTLDDLKSTLAPRKSKSSRAEELIDELTDYWDDPDDIDNQIGHSAYHKLIELGFDAVPALIEHLEDKRLTRTSGRGINQIDARTIRVGELVSGLLDGLADGAIGAADAWWFYGTFANPDAARKWWTKAQKIGEEQWLLDHAIRPTDDDEADSVTRTNRLILRTLGAKYPNRLPALYQTILLKRRNVESEKITDVIAGSKLSHKQKITLLAEGAAHADYAHRFAALQELSVVDVATFQRYLFQALEQFPTEIKDPGQPTPALRIASLIRRTDDQKCWNALAAATRRASPELRLEIIDGAGWRYSPNEATGNRRECIRYLVSFLGDRSGEARVNQSVGDFALIQLAYVLGINDSQVIQLPQSPREISILRDRVRTLAEHELARPSK